MRISNIVNSLRNRLFGALFGVAVGMALGILLLIRTMRLDPMIAAMLVVVAQVLCAHLVRNWIARLLIDSAIIGMILSYSLMTGSWTSVIVAILLAPVCAIIVAFISRPGAE
jgi:hypothetical protein